MTEKKAFPASASLYGGGGELVVAQTGMTLLDYFAGQALASLDLQSHIARPAAEHLAKSSYEIGRAMLKESMEHKDE